MSTATIERKETGKELGFRQLDTAEIVTQLNTTLCAFQVFFHKLQNFHWNVTGSDFYDIHDFTEEMYQSTLKKIDDIAERIRVFGCYPAVSMRDYIKESIIHESDQNLTALQIVNELTEDIQKLNELLLGVHEKSSLHGDLGTAYLVSKWIAELEKEHWQLTSWAHKI